MITIIDPIFTDMFDAPSLRLSISDRLGASIDWRQIYTEYCVHPSSDEPDQAFFDVLFKYAQIKSINQFLELLNSYNMGIEEIYFYKDGTDYKHDYERNAHLRPVLVNACDIKYIPHEHDCIKDSPDEECPLIDYGGGRTPFRCPEWFGYRADDRMFHALRDIAQDADVACILAQNQYAGDFQKMFHLIFEVTSTIRQDVQQWRWAGEWFTQECYDSLINNDAYIKRFVRELKSEVAVADYSDSLLGKFLRPKVLIPTLIGAVVAGYAWHRYASDRQRQEMINRMKKTILFGRTLDCLSKNPEKLTELILSLKK